MPRGRPSLAEPRPGVPVLPSVRIERFFARRLRHGKGRFAGQPFVLEGWELDEWIRPVYDTLQPDGLRRYREAELGIGKKNGKTHIDAGLGAYGTFADGRWRRDPGSPTGWLWIPEYGAEVYNVAGSEDQAKVLFNLALSWVERDPILRSATAGHIYKDAIEVPETESVWRVLAANGRLAHGPNPSTSIIDEIWVHTKPDLYDAFASAGAARDQPLVLITTTAGFDQDTIAYKLYQRGLKARDPRFYFKWFAAPDGCKLDDRKAWRMANPSKWVTNGYLADELKRARSLGLENEFRRFHLNQWTSAKEQAIPYALWDGGKGRPRIDPGAVVRIGVDAAPKRDSTAIAVDHRDEGRVHHIKATKMVADPDTGYLDFDALEDTLRELCRTYDVEKILVDPFNMIRSMLLLQEEGLPIEEFPQGDVRMVPAAMNLYELLIDGRIRHGGLAWLRAQVGAAVKKITSRGWRLDKLKSQGIIDGLVAVAIAAYSWEQGEEEDDSPSLFG